MPKKEATLSSKYESARVSSERLEDSESYLLRDEKPRSIYKKEIPSLVNRIKDFDENIKKSNEILQNSRSGTGLPPRAVS